MKTFYLLLLLSFLLYPQTNEAQDRRPSKNYSVKGRVIDAVSGNPLEYTTVSLHDKSDSSLVTGNVTDEAGNFEIDVPAAGTYWIEVQFISYSSIKIPAVTLNDANPVAALGDIRLREDSETLSEVVVAADKQQMELSLDKRVFNVASDLTNRGRNASEILDNVPSVTVDVEGNVNLRGSSNVRILVDGKPSGLVGLSSPDALRMLQGDLIERIEVITNPSARYEAEGMAGIINIILKKERRNGLNGSFTLNLGHPENYGASLTVNLRKNWMNLFSSYGVNYGENPGGGETYQEFYNQDSIRYTNQTNDRVREGLSHNFRIGSDFYLSETSILTASFLYRVSDQESTSDIFYRNTFSWNDLVSRTNRRDIETEDDSNFEYELNYEKSFAREGQKLTIATQYRDGGEIEESDIIENTFLGNSNESSEPLFQRSFNEEKSSNVLLQVDYLHPFGSDGKFELGYRGNLRKIETDYYVEEIDSLGNWVGLPGYINNFIYEENIHALYGILGNKTGKFSYQAGLRVELSDIGTELVETNEVNNREYFSFFPSAHLTYELTKETSLQASYSRRLNRPNFWNLNPFFSFSDARNIRTGNPNLDPDFTNSYEVGYLRNWERSSLYAGAYYRRTTDVIQGLSRAQGDTTFSRPENFGTRDSYGFEANLSKDISSWWKINFNGNLYRAITEGTAYEKTLRSDTYTMSGRLNSRITFWKGVNYQTNFNYRAPEETPQGKRKAFYSIDMALSKDILQGKGSLTLSVSDLLNSRKWRSETFGENFYSDSEFQWRARQIRLSFSYRLNQKKSAQRERGPAGGGEYEGGGEEGGF